MGCGQRAGEAGGCRVLCRLVGAGLEEAGWRVTCTLFFGLEAGGDEW